MNGPADRSVRLLLLISGALLASDTARIALDRGSHAEPVADLFVQVNSDPADRLRALPGIGPVIAERVIEQRSFRPFRDGDDFTRRVRGLGPAFFANYGDWMAFEEIGESRSEPVGEQVDRP